MRDQMLFSLTGVYILGLVDLFHPYTQAKDAHVGAVKSFQSPKAPTPPPAPTDLATELAAYDATEPTLAETSTTPTPAAQAQGDVGSAEAFLHFLEQDHPKADAHH